MSVTHNVSQKNQILIELLAGKKLTIREIFTDLNINSPSKRLSEIKADGYPLIIEEDKGVNQSGRATHWTTYRMDMDKICPECQRAIFASSYCTFCHSPAR
jgi:hypothetical protein